MNRGSNPCARTIWYHGGKADAVDLKSTVRRTWGFKSLWYYQVMKKPSKKKQRNAFAVQANTRGSSGPMRNKKDKRKNGKNKQQEYLNENY